MSRHLHLHADSIWIHFPYDEELVQAVRALPESRWVSDRKAWRIPQRYFAVVVTRLEEYRFKFTPEFRRLWEERHDEIAQIDEPDGWTVSQVNSKVKAAIDRIFDGAIWVVGELQGFDKARASGHRTLYFELVERPRPTSDPVAKVSCICFANTRMRIADRLREVDDIEFRDGLRVRILARPDLYQKGGKFQLTMEDIDPHFTAGELRRRREEVIEAMRQRGIAEQNKELAWPVLPLRVALITSPSGDARQDFEVELRQSGFPFRVEVFEAAMQGERTEATVVAAFDQVARRADEFDVICLVRGGGSRSDLAFFDTEAIAEAVCRAPLKVVVGIGHERDQCALDALCVSAKTPTAAASTLVDRLQTAEERLDRASNRLVALASRRLDASTHRWREAAYRVTSSAPRLLKKSERRLDGFRDDIAEVTRDRLRHAHRTTDLADERLTERTRANVSRASQRLNWAELGLDVDRLSRLISAGARDVERTSVRLERAVTGMLREKEERLTGFERATRLIHPDRIVERGFAVLRRDGKVVTSARGLVAGDLAQVRLRDGEVDVEITKIHAEIEDE